MTKFIDSFQTLFNLHGFLFSIYQNVLSLPYGNTAYAQLNIWII